MELEYSHRGVRTLTILHERNLREFLQVWQQFTASSRSLPTTHDPSYASPEQLLRHVLGCARHYMVWMCEKLELPDPGIVQVPSAEDIEVRAQEYLDHVVHQWRHPLIHLTEKASDRAVFKSAWGVEYCIDGMLEHAVMHPVRHTFQLRELMEQQIDQS